MEISNIKLYKNPSNWSRVVLCDRRDKQAGRNITKLTVARRNYANAPETLN